MTTWEWGLNNILFMCGCPWQSIFCAPRKSPFLILPVKWASILFLLSTVCFFLRLFSAGSAGRKRLSPLPRGAEKLQLVCLSRKYFSVQKTSCRFFSAEGFLCPFPKIQFSLSLRSFHFSQSRLAAIKSRYHFALFLG